MSLINDMLRDLERRRAPERYPNGVTLGGIGWEGDGSHLRHQRWGLYLSGAVAVAVALLIIKGIPHSPVDTDGAGLILPVEPAPHIQRRLSVPPAAGPDTRPHAYGAVPPPVAAAGDRAVPASPLAPPARRAGDESRAAAVVSIAPLDLPERGHATANPSLSSAPVLPAGAVDVVSHAVAAASAAPMKISARPPSPAERVARLRSEALGLIRDDNLDEAERRLTEALGIDPQRIAVREALVGLMVKDGRLAQAGEVLRQGLALHPGAPALVELQARIFMMEGDDQRARGLLEQHAPALAVDPGYHAMLAAVYQRLGDYAKAQAVYEALVTQSPDNGVWWMGLGLSMEGTGQMKEAREAYRRAQQTGGLTPKLRQFIAERLASLS